MQLILASQSEGRKYLLKQLKIPFEIIHTDLDEEKIVGKSPVDTIQLRAKLKAEKAVNKLITHNQSRHSGISRLNRGFSTSSEHDAVITHLSQTASGQPTTLILSADTEVIFNNQPLGKPKNYDEAVRILKMLSGKTHEVISGYYIMKIPITNPEIRMEKGKAKIWQGFDRSFVTFRKLTDKDIKLYLSLTDYTRYTGGYALIASPHTFITKIEGSLSNVVGLPLEKVIPILRINKFLT